MVFLELQQKHGILLELLQRPQGFARVAPGKSVAFE